MKIRINDPVQMYVRSYDTFPFDGDSVNISKEDFDKLEKAHSEFTDAYYKYTKVFSDIVIKYKKK